MWHSVYFRIRERTAEGLWQPLDRPAPRSHVWALWRKELWLKLKEWCLTGIIFSVRNEGVMSYWNHLQCETWNHTALPECYQLGGNAVFSIPLKMPQRMDAWLLNSREWYSGSWYPGHSSSLRSSSVWNVRRENLWNGYRDFTCGPQWPRMWGGFREWGWQTEQYTILCTIANRRGFDLIWDIPKHYQK